MRIFYAADNRPTGGLSQSDIWHYNLFLPLCDLGHELIPLDYDLNPHFAHVNPADPECQQFNQVHQPQLESELLSQVETAHRQKPLDLFFSYFYSSFVRPEVIAEIRRMGILTVNWYSNASYQFDLVSEIAPAYDFCLSPEKFRLEYYRRVGANPIYCQMAANPTIYKPYPLPKEFAVSFVGGGYGERPGYIRYLLDQKIDVNVWGPLWEENFFPKPASMPRLARRWASQILHGKPLSGLPWLPKQACHGFASDQEMIFLYSRSKISLGFSTVGETHTSNQPIKQMRLRDFEAPMSGAFYITGALDELADFFEPGKEIIFYYEKHDLADKIRYYLIHDSEREQIRMAGLKRAQAEHTWQIRFKNAFQQMGLN